MALDALVGLPRPGRRSDTDEAGIIARTLEVPPESLGVTHWSSRLLAREMDVSNVTIAKVWRKYGLQPWRTETFKFSTDPELDAKVRDVVGLYLNPPDNAVVVCVDEKSQVQALDRTAPILPMRPGLPEKRTHDYVRHGTTTLFTALNVATARSSTPATTSTATSSSWPSSARSPAPTRGCRCTSSATTTPPTSTRPSSTGWPNTPGYRCTSPRPRAAG